MQIKANASNPLEIGTSCLIVPLFQDEELSGTLARINQKLNGLVAQIMAEDGIKGAVGDSRVLYTQCSVAGGRVIVL